MKSGTVGGMFMAQNSSCTGICRLHFIVSQNMCVAGLFFYLVCKLLEKQKKKGSFVYTFVHWCPQHNRFQSGDKCCCHTLLSNANPYTSPHTHTLLGVTCMNSEWQKFMRRLKAVCSTVIPYKITKYPIYNILLLVRGCRRSALDLLTFDHVTNALTTRKSHAHIQIWSGKPHSSQ